MAVLAPELPFSPAQNIFLLLLKIRVEDLIKNKKGKSVKIKGGGESAKGNDTWDFALVRTNNGKTARQYCKKQGFTTPVEADGATVYESLGGNVETKQETTGSKKETKICN